MRRSKQPKRKFPGIQLIWSGGTWKSRAITRVEGRDHVGTVRDSQKEAFEDHERMRDTASRLGTGKFPDVAKRATGRRRESARAKESA